MGLNTPSEVAQHVKALNDRYHFEFMTADHGALGKGYVNEMRKWYRLPILNAEKNDKPGYIELLNGAIDNEMVIAIEGQCATFIEQAQALIWKNELRKEEMPGLRNHSCDSVLYWWRKSGHYEPKTRDTTKEGMDELELRAVAHADAQHEQIARYGVNFPIGYL
jgi:hypothetical protein